ncbi:hypothetical protein CTheo_5852 [Ceratobasidium theobromae]|uniref:Globin-sensor domain-containing protein n=1 Tax=Ceratobasidium theobromae TaxID=1582974 RepID=A0A5N5QGA8_9AGAM|nr:hypothetical protein CTheo_5852 [Ceratobasidium theobromae]
MLPIEPSTTTMPPMQHVDAELIETDLQARIDYLAKFIEFGAADVEALHGAAPIVKGLVPAAVDAVYEKLFSFDITRASFMTRHTGFQGKVAARLEDITHESEQIKFRKDILKVWVVKVFTADYTDPKTFEYLDRVGVMHTGKSGFKHREKKDPLFVDYVHCAILLGYVQSMLTSAVMGQDLPEEVKTATLVAINKVMWIQNDLFARHYISAKPAGAGSLLSWNWVCPAVCACLAVLMIARR